MNHQRRENRIQIWYIHTYSLEKFYDSTLSASSRLKIKQFFQPEMVESFREWESMKQTDFVKSLLREMCHEQHMEIDTALRPLLMRDFISALPEYVAEQILSYLDANSLCNADRVSRRWREIVSNGHLWRKLIIRNVNTISIWHRLGKRRGWYVSVS